MDVVNKIGCIHMDFSQYRLDLVNVCTGKANNFSKDEEIDQAIEARIREYRDERFLNAESYLRFLIFCCDVSRLDIAYFMLNVVDVNSPSLEKYLVESKEVLRIKKFSDKEILSEFQKKSLFPLERVFDQSAKNYFFDRLRMLQKKEKISHFDNMVLSFILYLILENTLIRLTAEECIEIFQYFKVIKKCNTIRRDVVFFKLTSYCLKHNIKDYFLLPKKYYNHNTQILSRLTRCSFFEDPERWPIVNTLVSSIRCNNDLGAPPPKVAVCISGMYRNHLEGLDSIYENIVKPLNADVFIHTWDQTSVWAGLGGSPTAARIFGENDKDIFPLEKGSLLNYAQWWPNTIGILKSEINKSTVEDFFNILKPRQVSIENADNVISGLGDMSGFTELRGTLNQIKMFYSIKKSFDMALNTYDYDYIVKVRPDVLISDKVSSDFFTNVSNNIFYANINNPTGLSDQIFVLSSSMAYSFSQFVARMLKQGRLSIFENFPLYDSHNLILSWLLNNNYEIGPRKVFFSILPNAEVVIPGLSDALHEDFNNMTDEDQRKFKAFKEFLLQRNA